jgi:hypothetical protein
VSILDKWFEFYLSLICLFLISLCHLSLGLSLFTLLLLLVYDMEEVELSLFNQILTLWFVVLLFLSFILNEEVMLCDFMHRQGVLTGFGAKFATSKTAELIKEFCRDLGFHFSTFMTNKCKQYIYLSVRS